MNKTQKYEFDQIHGSLSNTLDRAYYYIGQMERQANLRYCYWDGQNDTGRKKGKLLGEDPFPWEDAHDQRVRLAEEIIAEDVDTMMAAWHRARLSAAAVEAGDAEKSGVASTLLKNLVRQRCAHEIDHNLRLALNWSETYALSFLHIGWQEEFKVHREQTDTQRLTQLVMAGLMDRDTLAAFADPDREDTAANFIAENLSVGARTARKIVRDLREDGTAEFERSEEGGGLPYWRALKPWVDVFFPTDTGHIQNSDFVWIRETYSEDGLEHQAHLEGWRDKFVKTVKQKGPIGKVNSVWNRARQNRTQVPGTRSSPVMLFGDERELYEIFRCYRKSTDTDGAQRIDQLIMSQFVQTEVGHWDLHPYEHQKYPLVAIPYEMPERRYVECRGVPDLVETHQYGIKWTRDFRGNRADITQLPPLRTPTRSGKRWDIKMGPAAQLPDRTGSQFNWLQPPAYDPASQQFEDSIYAEVSRLFGRAVDGVPPTRIRAYQERLVNQITRVTEEALTQTLQLAQQYLSTTKISRITGSTRENLEVTGDEIRGEFDLNVEVSADEMDMDLMVRKAEAFAKMIVPLDSEGVIDRADLVTHFARGFDPQLAERVIEDKGTVRQQEIEDEKQQFSLMVTGVPPAMKEGQNYALRRKTLIELIQGNPEHQQRYQESEVFRNLVENRLKFFNQQIDQQNNAVTGRFGVDPERQMEAQ